MVTYGDPTLNPTLSKGKAKDQTLTGIDSQTNTIVGDVNYITNKGSGGKDKLTGGDDASNFLFGDAQFDMHDSAKGETISWWAAAIPAIVNSLTSFTATRFKCLSLPRAARTS